MIGTKFMHDARYLISHYCLPIPMCGSGKKFDPRTTLREGAIHGECSNHWGLAFCPDEKILIFRTTIASQIEARQRHADRLVEQYLAVHGNKFTDDAERQIERLLSKAGQ